MSGALTVRLCVSGVGYHNDLSLQDQWQCVASLLKAPYSSKPGKRKFWLGLILANEASPCPSRAGPAVPKHENFDSRGIRYRSETRSRAWRSYLGNNFGGVGVAELSQMTFRFHRR